MVLIDDDNGMVLSQVMKEHTHKYQSYHRERVVDNLDEEGGLR